MYNFKQKPVRLPQILLFFALLFVVVTLIKPASVNAIQCPIDPDYPAAGSTEEPTAECARTSYYQFAPSSNPSAPVIEYFKRSSQGTESRVATLYLISGTGTDPLVWKGMPNYNPTHSILISINKGDFSASLSGTRATRTDGNTQTVIQIPLNDVAKEFATQNNVAVNTGSGNLDADCKNTNINKDNCGIVSYLVRFIQFLSGIVGIIIVIIIAVGGIQYSMAKDNAQEITAAKERIKNAVIALLAYIFMFAFLQWLVPGGIV